MYWCGSDAFDKNLAYQIEKINRAKIVFNQYNKGL
jgi:hypothetical protein